MSFKHFILNYLFSALAVGDPLARVPYARLKKSNAIGLPVSMHLRHPSAMTYDQLKLLYHNMATIKFVAKLYA